MSRLLTAKGHRLETLDYLRGLAATSIMVYHYASWSGGQVSTSYLLGRMGIFGVVIFYILSGLTLTHVYGNKLEFTNNGLIIFYTKRALRIFPLLWAATFFSVVLSKHLPAPIDIFLNLTGLFGFIKWYTYFATGAWSIGNELVFYSFFPLLLFAFRKGGALLLLAASLLTASYLFYSFFLINPDKELSSQWSLYTNPLNQGLFFFSGMALNWLFSDKEIGSRTVFILLTISVLTLALFPTSGQTIDLITGFTRVVFTFSCIFICLSFYKSHYVAPSLLHSALSFLGRTSYSIYLLHPIVYTVLKALFSLLSKRNFVAPSFALAIFASIVTLFISYYSYEYFEAYFTNLGRKSDLRTK